ncbi:MAG: DUF1223 domain-containing protein [Reyranella sp.]|uniref:DUF1223 domain-containing protein n=1 Tax=Reyranella sp. TaxID=1929291 RepID=UPI001219C4A1|nr:DUF1223 domain-containing protein [Reyranella sp.]TAJ84377.1 MAG: DUF1223 domain-containing protein [Reyranella sp.]TBR22789.1 MAG: DUF1223 domain-containing protein [Reyranella sp.]
MSLPLFPGRRSVMIGAAAVAAGLSKAASARPAGEGPWAVELFTSQGCSSCPPADALLGRLSMRPDIVALAFHVDYWDYIGWKDPFASRDTTERQRAYARVLKQRYVYTPEMVVDGIGHDTGRDRAPIEALLTRAQAQSPRRATPTLSRGIGGPLTIKLAAFPLDGRTADVTLAIYDRRHTTPVKSGENQGRMIENFNVVRQLELVDRWDGAAKDWTIAGDRIGPTQGVAVLVQQTDHGPMIGCNKLEPAYSG